MKKILTISGVTLGGKTQLKIYLEARGFEPIVTTTTRPPRSGELSGREYHFVTNSEFNKIRSKNGFIESVTFGIHQYGVTVAEIKRVLETGRCGVIVMEPNGKRAMRGWCQKNNIPVVSVFIGGSPLTIASRFMERYIDSGTPRDRAIERLSMMLLHEHNWIRAALSGSSRYDMVLHRFESDNTGQALVDIIRLCND